MTLSPPAQHRSLRAILNPRSVAVIGASDSTAKFGGRVMHYLMKHGFSGDIYPVNPGAREILGRAAYPSIAMTPRPIDVALLALPGAGIAAALEQCGAAGVAGCVVLSADFAESGTGGAARQDELVRIARAHGMRLLGPNCLGFINPAKRLALTSSVALAAAPMPVGAIGLVSQSGSLMASLISHARDHGTGFSAAVSVGNQADLELCDFIEYFLEDGDTRAICVYAEGLKDAKRFLALAARCRSAGKPLLAVKAGSSAAGAHLAMSHTASLAGGPAIWRAACQENAVIMLDDPEAMIQCAHLLIAFGPPQGTGVAAMSPSGGTIAITADRLASAGLRLAELAPRSRDSLHEIVPESRPVNPLDVGGLAREAGLDAVRRCYDIFADDIDCSAILVVVATTPQLLEKVEAWGARALARGKPTLLLLTPGSLVDDARNALRKLGCPFVNRMDDAMRLLKASIDYGNALRAAHGDGGAVPFSPTRLLELSFPAPQLTESEAKTLLRAAGIATPCDRIVRNAEEAVSAAAEIGYPIAMKLSSRTLTHKSDVGGVKLGLSNDDAVRQAWQEIATALASADARHPLECAVQPMVSGGVELIVGSRWDAQFGATVVVGAGGIWVEMLDDTQLALAPVTPSRAHALISALRIWPLLAGGRSQPPADIAALVDVIVRVSWLAATLGPRLAELDVNPLLVRGAGDGAIALDARASIEHPAVH